jgi:predicted neutral ceramidase superfamily lipid hydrolase
MKKYKAHLIAIGIVTVWAIFAYAWLSVEDGSSGLSVLGKASAVFFLPGGLLMQSIRGSFSSAEIPLAAVISWLIFSLIVLLITQVTTMILNCKKAK